jgi:hypothetical protein
MLYHQVRPGSRRILAIVSTGIVAALFLVLTALFDLARLKRLLGPHWRQEL